ncbi:ankyrin repeat domain-containing protein [Paenibacillus sp. WQ 127069]|uniref:Ankyrin repeat domain-containing protein n=1 Tax=Paenibacillus baimaensis TaxID=2982185 RepID=A0ABT2UIQ1_9BACL|nr:ankyrin repeat domain-containing protein [Paenibacillus sp. WQ 127069]MCU6794522.1 ankyrin repeat domain-containing protein [Paenibacillus sp. WQ 127069]
MLGQSVKRFVAAFVFVFLLAACEAKPIDSNEIGKETPNLVNTQSTTADVGITSAATFNPSTTEDPSGNHYKVTLDGKTFDAVAVVHGTEGYKRNYSITLSNGERLEEAVDGIDGSFVQLTSQGKHALLLHNISGGSGGDSFLSTLVRIDGKLSMKHVDFSTITPKSLTHQNAPSGLLVTISDHKLEDIDLNPFSGADISGSSLIRNYKSIYHSGLFGEAQYEYNFTSNTFQFVKIISYTYEDPLDRPVCKGIQLTDQGYSITDRNVAYNILMAVGNDRKDIVNKFTQCGQSPDFAATAGDLTPLITAIRSGNLSMVKELILIGANPLLRKNEYTPYIVAVYLNANDDRKRFTDIANFMRKYATSYDMAALQLFSLPKVEEVSRLVKAANVNINLSAFDGFNGTPLGFALAKGTTELVRALLENGADPKLRFGSEAGGYTPIVYAIQNKKFDAAQYLIRSGVDINGLYSYSYVTHSLLGKTLIECDAAGTSFLAANGAKLVSYYASIDGDKLPVTDAVKLVNRCENSADLLKILGNNYTTN